MREIELTRGKVALVDDRDYESMAQFKWHISSHGYAIREVKIALENGKIKRIVKYMHREILGLGNRDEDSREVDHEKGNKLDNRRSKIRACTLAQNRKNQKKHKNNTSGFKGVSPHHSGKWVMRITNCGKKIRVHGFETPELAHEFYCLAADMLHGEFANHGG